MLHRHKLLYKSIIVLSIAILVLPSFCFAQTSEKGVKIPENFGEAKEFAINLIKSLPGAMKAAWQEAKAIWQKTWVKWWNNSIKPWFQSVWYEKIKPFADKIINKVKTLLGQEIEKREPILKEEFQKEKEELKIELPKVKKSFWEKFKELIK